MIIEKCPTCGGPVKVVGKTTKHYEPVAEQDAIRKMREIQDIRDPEARHYNADGFIIEWLKENGFDELAKAYDEALNGCWYA